MARHIQYAGSFISFKMVYKSDINDVFFTFKYKMKAPYDKLLMQKKIFHMSEEALFTIEILLK